MAVSETDVDRATEAARVLPRAAGNYLESDFVMNLLATVVDFQTHTTAVVKALEHFKALRSAEIRTMTDMEDVLARHPDDQEGNTALAQYLWGYKMWTRARMLRGLVAYFETVGVRDQASLARWASTAEFRRDFRDEFGASVRRYSGGS